MCNCHMSIVGTLKFAMSQVDRAIHRILAHVRDSCNDSALGNQMDDGSGPSYNKRAVIDFDMIQVITVTFGYRL